MSTIDKTANTHDTNVTLPPEELQYFEILAALNAEFAPHPGQKEVEEALFARGLNRAFVRCGRGFGKSVFGVRACYIQAMMFPKSNCYYVAPMLKQVRDIVWHTRIATEFLGDDWTSRFIRRVDNQETRIEFNNGSFIKFDGSENFNAHRGYKPHIIVADEFADFDSRWLPAMLPNLGKVKGSKILFLGTPPEFPQDERGQDHQYVALDKEFQARVEKGDRVFHIHYPSHKSPFLDADFLEEERVRLEDANERFVYDREYLALIVSGSKRRIFPHFSRGKHGIAEEELRSKIQENPSIYEYYCVADPGTKSTFAVTFVALNRYSSEFFVLDEIYEQDTAFMTVSKICPAIQKICKKWGPAADWIYYADSAAAWFIEEAYDRYDLTFTPTMKRAGDKEEGIATLNDYFRLKEGFISNSCEGTFNEAENYQTDASGRIRKINDHILDCLRYWLSASYFSFNPDAMPEKNPRGARKTWYSMEDDVKDLWQEDLNTHILSKYD